MHNINWKAYTNVLFLIALLFANIFLVSFTDSLNESDTGFSDEALFVISTDGEVSVNKDMISIFTGKIVIPPVINGITVSSIKDFGFGNCHGLSEIIIPNTVIYIGSHAFVSCENLKCVELPDSVKKTGIMVFHFCTNLEKVKLSSGMDYIEYYTFADCKNLTDVIIPESIKEIGPCAFVRCEKLREINLPKSLLAIDKNAFCECISLESVVIPDSVLYLDSVFISCENLTQVGIPKSVVKIKSEFYSCSKLSDIIIDSNNKFYAFENGVLYNKNKSVAEGSLKNIKEITLADSVLIIGEYSFIFCNNVSTITIPNSVKIIRKGALDSCISLKEINYQGTIEQWEFISKEDSWHFRVPATVVHCIDGDVLLD